MTRRSANKAAVPRRAAAPRHAPGSPLATWLGLNAYLKNADAAACRALLRMESAGAARPSFLLRIHSRLNFVRAARERDALLKERAARS